jgi:hypothetical protein
VTGGATYGVRLDDVGERLLEIGTAYAKCLACHCFREVVDEAVQLLEDAAAGPGAPGIIGTAATAAVGPLAPGPAAAASIAVATAPGAPTSTDPAPSVAERLRDLLAEREGSHG